MEQVKLLQEYVSTLQRQLNSKNEQIKTLVLENERLMDQNRLLQLKDTQSTRKQSHVVQLPVFQNMQIGNRTCNDCARLKGQINQMQVTIKDLEKRYTQFSNQKGELIVQNKVLKSEIQRLNSKIKSLEEISKNTTTTTTRSTIIQNQRQNTQLVESSSVKSGKSSNYQTNGGTRSASIKVYPTACKTCSKYKAELEELKSGRQQLSGLRSGSTTTTSVVKSCSACQQTRRQLRVKQQTIIDLRGQLHQLNNKVFSLVRQLQKVQETAQNQELSKRIVQQQQNQIIYFKGQLDQYVVQNNNLRSELLQANQQLNNRLAAIRQLQNRPPVVKYVEIESQSKQVDPEIVRSINELKIQVGQLSQDNILLRRENENLRQDLVKVSGLIMQDRQSSIREQRHYSNKFQQQQSSQPTSHYKSSKQFAELLLQQHEQHQQYQKQLQSQYQSQQHPQQQYQSQSVQQRQRKRVAHIPAYANESSRSHSRSRSTSPINSIHNGGLSRTSSNLNLNRPSHDTGMGNKFVTHQTNGVVRLSEHYDSRDRKQSEYQELQRKILRLQKENQSIKSGVYNEVR